MHDGRTTPCPVCRAALSPDARDCGACRVALTTQHGVLVPSLPAIRPGALLVNHDYRAQPLPGKASRGPEVDSAAMRVDPHRDGVVATFSKDTTYTAQIPGNPIRDACIRGVFTPLGPGARLALVARWKPLQTAAMFYSFELSVDGASGFMTCVVTSKGTSDRIALTKGIAVPAAAARPIVMEFLCQGPTLRGLVGGQPVFSLHDARFGEGTVGFRVGREPCAAPTTSVLCHAFQVAEVAP